MANREDRKKPIYLPGQLVDKLKLIPDYPLTIISAPMGYGKTTSLRKFLYHMTEDTWEEPPVILWQVLLGDGEEGFWEDFTSAFALLYPSFSESIAKNGIPLDTASQRAFMHYFQEICYNCGKSMVLVLDNAELAVYDNVRSFLHFFVNIIPQNFHLILAGRASIFKNDDFFRIYGFANYVSKEDFEFTPKDIEQYFKLSEITLSGSEIQHLHTLSSGWIAIIHMNLVEYIEHGIFLPEQEIFQIINRTIYSDMPDRVKEFLSVISITDSFSVEQAEYMWGKGDAENILNELVSNSTFISYNRGTCCYSLSPIAMKICESQKSKLSAAEVNKRLNKLADWYLKSDENYLARRLYHRIKNFDALMDAVEKRVN